MPNPIHLLILETDKPLPGAESANGSYADVFTNLFQRVAKEENTSIETTAFCVCSDDEAKFPTHEQLSTADAILISGSKSDAHGNDAWVLKLMQFIKDVFVQHPHLKLSGVCFGHQIIARALGGKTIPGEKWELSHTEIKLNDIGKTLFHTKDDTLHLHQMHCDVVVEPPAGAEIWGSSEATEVQGCYLKGRIFTTQGHLGYTEEMVKANLKNHYENESIEKDEAVTAARKAGRRHDGDIVVAALIQFYQNSGE